MDYDDTLPLPADVERAFNEHAGDGLTAVEWLEERGIEPAAVKERVALIRYDFAWNWEAERYDFNVYSSEIVGLSRIALAVPVVEGGKFVDLLLIGDDHSFETVCGRAAWLGTITPTTRLHAHPLDWLEAGCAGACHIAPITRKGFKELQRASTIECNDIHTALEAWDWAFNSDEDELSRFEVDDTAAAIEAYYEREIKWYAGRVAVDMEARRPW